MAAGGRARRVLSAWWVFKGFLVKINFKKINLKKERWNAFSGNECGDRVETDWELVEEYYKQVEAEQLEEENNEAWEVIAEHELNDQIRDEEATRPIAYLEY